MEQSGLTAGWSGKKVDLIDGLTNKLLGRLTCRLVGARSLDLGGRAQGTHWKLLQRRKRIALRLYNHHGLL